MTKYNDASQNVQVAAKNLQEEFQRELQVCKGESFTVARQIAVELKFRQNALAVNIDKLSENIGIALNKYLQTHEEERSKLSGILGSDVSGGGGAPPVTTTGSSLNRLRGQ